MVSEGALVFSMMAWISTTGLVDPVWPEATLELNVTNSAGMVEDIHLCLKRNEVEPLTADELAEAEEYFVPNLHGMYCLDRISINGDLVDLETPEGQTTLVHELVHWMQDHNGDMENATCPAEVEAAAYAVGWAWQEAMGLPPSPDEFTVAMRSMCWEGGDHGHHR